MITKKNFLLYSLIFNCTLSTVCDPQELSFWYVLCKALCSEAYGCANNIQELQDAIQEHIATLFALDNQPVDVWPELRDMQIRMTREVMQQLHNSQHKSWQSVTLQAKELTQSAALQFITHKTRELALDNARRIRNNPPINPAHLKAVSIDTVVKKTEEAILYEAQQSLHANNNNATLKNFVGYGLMHKVEAKVNREFGVYDAMPQAAPAGQQSAPARPAAGKEKAAAPKEIYEVYPDFHDADRNKDYHRRRENGQWHREESCSVCLENFLELKKPNRVTLFCGHSICPTCLFDMLYMTNNKACPLCRDAIRLDEFSVNYLRKHVDVNALKENHPGQQHKIQQFFP